LQKNFCKRIICPIIFILCANHIAFLPLKRIQIKIKNYTIVIILSYVLTIYVLYIYILYVICFYILYVLNIYVSTVLKNTLNFKFLYNVCSLTHRILIFNNFLLKICLFFRYGSHLQYEDYKCGNCHKKLKENM